MATAEKISEKENSIRVSLEKLRSSLNSKRVAYNKNPTDWVYLTSLAYTENKLNEVLKYLETVSTNKD